MTILFLRFLAITGILSTFKRRQFSYKYRKKRFFKAGGANSKDAPHQGVHQAAPEASQESTPSRVASVALFDRYPDGIGAVSGYVSRGSISRYQRCVQCSSFLMLQKPVEARLESFRGGHEV